MTTLESAAAIGVVCGAVLGVGSVILMARTFLKWLGKQASGFVTDTVVPEFEKMTTALDRVGERLGDLSEKTEHNSKMLTAVQRETVPTERLNDLLRIRDERYEEQQRINATFAADLNLIHKRLDDELPKRRART